jgi:hypothetical protein
LAEQRQRLECDNLRAHVLEELEAEKQRLQQERALAAQRAGLKQQLRGFSLSDVVSMFQGVDLPGGIWRPEVLLDTADGQGGRVVIDVPRARRTLAALVQRIELDPATRSFLVHYRVPLGGKAGQRWRPHGNPPQNPL